MSSLWFEDIIASNLSKADVVGTDAVKTLYDDTIGKVEAEIASLKSAVSAELAVNSFMNIIHEIVTTLESVGVDAYSAWDRLHESKTVTGVPADHTGITGWLGSIFTGVEHMFGFNMPTLEVPVNMPTIEVPVAPVEPVAPTTPVEPVIAAPAEPVQATVEVLATTVATATENPPVASAEPANAHPDVVAQ